MTTHLQNHKLTDTKLRFSESSAPDLFSVSSSISLMNSNKKNTFILKGRHSVTNDQSGSVMAVLVLKVHNFFVLLCKSTINILYILGVIFL